MNPVNKEQIFDSHQIILSSKSNLFYNYFTRNLSKNHKIILPKPIISENQILLTAPPFPLIIKSFYNHNDIEKIFEENPITKDNCLNFL